MAAAYVASGLLAGADSGNVSPGLPGGHALNHILLIRVYSHDNVTPTASGYTQVGQFTNGASMVVTLLAKRDSGSESTPTVTHTAGGTIHAQVDAYSGVDPTLPIGVGASSVFRDRQSATGSGTGNQT